MCVNVELLLVVLRRFQQNVQIRSGVDPWGEPQSHRWPTVFMLNGIEGLFVQVLVNENPFWVAGIRHAVVADKDDVNDIGEVTSFQSFVEVLSEDINSFQRILFCLSALSHPKQRKVIH